MLPRFCNFPINKDVSKLNCQRMYCLQQLGSYLKKKKSIVVIIFNGSLLLCFISLLGKHWKINNSLSQRYSCFRRQWFLYSCRIIIYTKCVLNLNCLLQIICEFLIAKDKPVSHFKRRAPNLLSMQVMGLFSFMSLVQSV